MDGVLADFFGEWERLVGKNWRDIEVDKIPGALQKIRDQKDFWINLPPTKNALNLLSIIKRVKGSYKILSTPLEDDPKSGPQKKQWVKKNLRTFLPKEVILSHKKEKYATQPDGTPNILIDDYGQNIARWEAAGGIGLKHKDDKFERTAKELKQNMTEAGYNDPPKTKAEADKKYPDVETDVKNKKSKELQKVEVSEAYANYISLTNKK